MYYFMYTSNLFYINLTTEDFSVFVAMILLTFKNYFLKKHTLKNAIVFVIMSLFHLILYLDIQAFFLATLTKIFCISFGAGVKPVGEWGALWDFSAHWFVCELGMLMAVLIARLDHRTHRHLQETAGGGDWAGRGCSIHCHTQRLGLRADHVKQGYGTCQHTWDPGLGEGLVKEVGEFLLAHRSRQEHESWVWGTWKNCSFHWHICRPGLRAGWARLGSSTCWHA